MVIAWPTPVRPPCAVPTGCRSPVGYGFESVADGVKLLSIEVMIGVDCEKPSVFWKLNGRGAQKIPKPPRNAVLALGDHATPARGPNFVVEGLKVAVALPLTPA